MRVAGRMLGSLLLGGVAILVAILIFRQGLLPLIEAAFRPGPELLRVFRRTGLRLTAVSGYWAFVPRQKGATRPSCVYDRFI